VKHEELGGGFKYFLFSPLPGEMIQFDYSEWKIHGSENWTAPSTLYVKYALFTSAIDGLKPPTREKSGENNC